MFHGHTSLFCEANRRRARTLLITGCIPSMHFWSWDSRVPPLTSATGTTPDDIPFVVNCKVGVQFSHDLPKSSGSLTDNHSDSDVEKLIIKPRRSRRLSAIDRTKRENAKTKKLLNAIPGNQEHVLHGGEVFDEKDYLVIEESIQRARRILISRAGD